MADSESFICVSFAVGEPSQLYAAFCIVSDALACFQFSAKLAQFLMELSFFIAREVRSSDITDQVPCVN